MHISLIRHEKKLVRRVVLHQINLAKQGMDFQCGVKKALRCREISGSTKAAVFHVCHAME